MATEWEITQERMRREQQLEQYDVVGFAPDVYTTMFSCHVCGALVPPQGRRKHSDYHDEAGGR
jgi:hypothetical protein